MADFNDNIVNYLTQNDEKGEVKVIVESDGCIRAISAENLAKCIAILNKKV